MIGEIYQRIRRWPAEFLHDQSMQTRVVVFTAFAVTASVTLVGLTAYLITRWSLYDQMDRELTQVANYMSGVAATDISTLGDLSTDALRSANASLIVVGADGKENIPVSTNCPKAGAAEIAIARLQVGYSARTAIGSDGVAYRMVAAPMKVGDDNYAVIIGRPINATTSTLDSMWLVMLAVGLIGVGSAAAMSYWIGHTLLSPVRKLSVAVQHITETDKLDPIE
ncbi:MAG: hypothetical protein CR979_03760, partial [Propionibacterium sp.]